MRHQRTKERKKEVTKAMARQRSMEENAEPKGPASQDNNTHTIPDILNFSFPFNIDLVSRGSHSDVIVVESCMNSSSMITMIKLFLSWLGKQQERKRRRTSAEMTRRRDSVCGLWYGCDPGSGKGNEKLLANVVVVYDLDFGQLLCVGS